MHQNRIEHLDWLQDPVFNTNGSEYLPFNEVFGKPTTDAARTSLKEKPISTKSDKQNKTRLFLWQVSINIVHIDVIDVSNLQWTGLNTLHLK